MDTRTFGRLDITLPGLNESGVHRSTVTSLHSSADTVQDFEYTGASLRDLDLRDTRLVTGRVSGLSAERTRLEQLVLDSIEFDGCDLRSLRWTGGKFSRVVFRNCRLLGADLQRLTLENVLFEGCRLDYATLDGCRAVGPLVFSACSLSEAVLSRCDLSGAHFGSCALRMTEFSGGRYRQADFRGSDLSAIRGLSALREIIIDRPQQTEIAVALAAELGITYGDALADPA